MLLTGKCGTAELDKQWKKTQVVHILPHGNHLTAHPLTHFFDRRPKVFTRTRQTNNFRHSKEAAFFFFIVWRLVGVGVGSDHVWEVELE
jgi:hypothetical protein